MSDCHSRLFIVDQSLLEPGGHYFEYSTAIAVGASSVGRQAVLLVNRALPSLPSGALPNGVELIPCFTHRWHEGAYEGPDRFGAGHLGQELFAALDRYAARPGDSVLIHTLGWHQAAEIFDRLLTTARSRQGDLPRFAVLLRYDPVELGLNMLEILRDRLKRIAASKGLSGKLFLYTDTDQLTERCAELFGFPCETLPIPFNQKPLFDALAGTPSRDGQTLTVTYVGDARDEKGYPLLPAAIARLWQDYVLPGRVRFILQSNFNTPGGEPQAAQARAQLERYPSPQVTLVRAPLDTRDYYDLIAATDILVVPYDPVRYALRSSGVLVEALTAGKVVVTTEGSWMETKVDRSHAVLFQSDALAPALIEAIEGYDLLARGARKASVRWRDDSAPRNFVESLERSMAHPAPIEAEGPSVLFVIDAESMVLRNGASRVALNQLDFLFRAGYRVTGLFVSVAADTPQTLFDLRRALEHELADLPFHDLHVAGYAPQADRELFDQIYRESSGKHSIDRDLAGRRGIAVPDLLVDRLRVRRPDFVLVNYVFNAPVLDRLPLDGAPILCEMHDIQSYQRAIYGKRDVDPGDLALEMALLAQCDHIIALNQTEADIVKTRLPHKPVSYIPIVAQNRPAALADLRGAERLSQLIAHCGCPRIEAGRSQYDDTLAAGLDRWTGVDLLVVSSAHLSNVSGLAWFFEQVYFPYLARAGVTVLVAGTIADSRAWLQHPNILFTGMVEHLDPLYAAAKVVILPIIEGAGSPVKTIEALASGKPVVATKVALRGLGQQTGLLTATDTPEAFAARVSSLLQDPSARLAAGRQSLKIGELTMSRAEYDRRLGATIRLMTGHAGPAPAASAPLSAPDDLVEWSATPGIVKRVASTLAGDHAIDAGALIEFHTLLQDSAQADNCRAMLRESMLTDPGALSALEPLLAWAKDGSDWWLANGRRQPIIRGRLKFLTGARIGRKVILRSGAQYAIEAVTSAGFGGQFRILLNGTVLSCSDVRRRGPWENHVFPVTIAGVQARAAGCEIVIEATGEFVLEDLRIGRQMIFSAEKGLIDGSAEMLPTGDLVQNYWLCTLTDSSLPLPILGLSDLALRVTVREAWSDSAARLTATLGGRPLNRVRERSEPYLTIIEFLPRTPSGGPNLRLDLPQAPNWPTQPVAVSAIEFSESLLPVPQDGTPERTAAFHSGELTIESFIDQITPEATVLGWVCCPQMPRLRLTVLAMAGTKILASTRADVFREDLLAAGKADGYCFFALPVGRSTLESHRGQLRFFVADGVNVIGELTS